MLISAFQRLTIILLLSALAACGNESPSIHAITASAAASEQMPVKPDAIRVALIMKTLTNPFFIEMENGARRAQQETGIALEVHTATQETSIEQQIKIVEDTVKAGVNAIVIAPGDSVRLIPALQQAQQQGIAIVNIDNRLDARAIAAKNMRPIPFISIDNEAAAFASAMELASRLPAGAEVAIIEGIPSADNAEQRRRGAQRAFKQAGLHQVASLSAHWKIDEGYSVAKKMLQQHPRISAIFCANDMMALGARKYLTESGHSKVLVAGFDAIVEARQALNRAELIATVDQQADIQGYQGVMTAIKVLHKQAVPAELKIDALILRHTANP